MDQIAPRKDHHAIKQWVPGTGLEFDRIITAINNHQITIDTPLTNALEQQYTNAIIWRYTFPGRISQVGIENLSSNGTAFTKDPGYLAKQSFFQATFAQVNAVENAWIRNVVFQHYGQGINIDRTAKWVTATDIDANMEVPKVSDPPEAFSIVGQQILISNCQVTGNYIHAWATMSGTAGPNVFTHCTATGDIKVDSSPHERWGTGTLYDDLSMPNGAFAVQNRGNLGTGHGWAGANNVLWNCLARSYLVQSPPTAQNWAIGCTGKINTFPLFPGPQGYIDSPDQPVQPTSLYAEQLAERQHTPNR